MKKLLIILLLPVFCEAQIIFDSTGKEVRSPYWVELNYPVYISFDGGKSYVHVPSIDGSTGTITQEFWDTGGGNLSGLTRIKLDSIGTVIEDGGSSFKTEPIRKSLKLFGYRIAHWVEPKKKR